MLRAKFLADHRSEVKLPDPNGLVTNFEHPLHEKLGNVTESELVPELQSTAMSMTPVGNCRSLKGVPGAVIEVPSTCAAEESAVANGVRRFLLATD